jgi:hypothetical protein
LRAIMAAKQYEVVAIPNQHPPTSQVYHPLGIHTIQWHESQDVERPNMLIEAVFIKSFFDKSGRDVEVELGLDSNVECAGISGGTIQSMTFKATSSIHYSIVPHANHAHTNMRTLFEFMNLHCLFWHSAAESRFCRARTSTDDH